MINILVVNNLNLRTMKKLTRKNLDELAKTLPVIEKKNQTAFVGGGSGTSADPYTQGEFDNMCSQGTWRGGFVSGWGYVSSEVICTPNVNYPGMNDYIAGNASSYIGVSESTHPDEVLRFLRDAGIANPSTKIPWCSVFVSEVYSESGVSNPNSAAVNDWRTWGDATNTPQVGDIAIFNSYSHIGIVTAVDGEYVTIVHGNSNANGNSGIVTSSRMHISNFTFRTR